MGKKLLALTLVFLLAATLISCAPANQAASQPPPQAAAPAPAPAAGAQPPPADVAPIPEAPKVVENEWGIANKMNDGSESADVLYELAKQEGKVVMYSISSRCAKVAESFNAQYPGVVMEAYDLGSEEILEKVIREHEANIQNADVVHCKDMGGSVYNELVLNNIFHNYYPDDISAHIDETYKEYAMPLYIELLNVFYNYELSDGPPITSWWDLTKPEWAGKFYFTSFTGTSDYSAVFTAFTMHADAFAEDYEKVFGQKIEYTCGIENAGYELIYRLLKNQPLYVENVDNALEGMCTATDLLIGWGPSSKLRNNASKGWKLAIVDITPYTGIPAQNNLYIVDNCPHPNAAKLLVRWMLGESDGTGEGNAPWRSLGGWTVRDDVKDDEGQPALSELNLCDDDLVYIYDNVSEVIDFITANEK